MRDYTVGDTFDIKFTTRAFATGAPTTLAGTPVISAYPDNSTTELTAGLTLTVDFDARTGLNNVRVVATVGNGYAAGSTYALVVTTGTVGGTSVVGEVVGEFTLGRSAAFVRLGAPAGASTAADVAAVKTDTAAVKVQTDKLAFTGANKVDASVRDWVGDTIPARNVAGVPLVDLKYTLGTISPAAAGSVRADAVTGAVGSVTGAVGSVTGAVGSVTGAVGSVTGNVGGNVVGSVGSVTGGVTVATNNDKTGYGLSAAAVQAIWDALTSALTTVGSVGKRIADFVTAVAPTATQNADALLDRDMSAGADTVARSPRNALRFLRNKRATAAGTLTVTKEDDTTAAWTAALTTDAAAVPVVTVDPA